MDRSSIHVEFHRRYPSDAEAEQLRLALEVDRPEYLTTSRSGAELRFEVRAESAASARATLDDLLAAITVAERTRELQPTSIAGRPGPKAKRRARSESPAI